MAVFNNPGGPPPAESEDCLYLNVYAPASPPPPEGRAVMYWIYGGSLQFGTAGQLGYNGSAFAAYQDVIVVTVNYRTNGKCRELKHISPIYTDADTVFGFPNSPELPLTGQNLGFLDQRAGLDWVQRNIWAFGGNPSMVTLFGESAGGVSVDALITSFPRDSCPPFRAAILESGQTSFRPAPGASAVPAWDYLAAQLNCTDTPSNLTCVRAAPAATIKNIIEMAALDFTPVADNVTLVSDPVARRAAGEIAYIPTLSGTNAQEGRVFLVGTTNLTAFLDTYFAAVPQLIPAVTAAYPTGDLPEGAKGVLTTPYDIASQIFTEFYFQCPEALFANASATAGYPTWRYYFNASFPDTQAYPDLLVYHSSEIPMVFRTYPDVNVTAQEFALSSTMQGAWAKFAKDPLGGPGWNAVGSASQFYGAPLDLDIGLFGNRLDAASSGVTVIRESEIDARCSLFTPLYQATSH
jgi:carboxylesterase type B